MIVPFNSTKAMAMAYQMHTKMIAFLEKIGCKPDGPFSMFEQFDKALSEGLIDKATRDSLWEIESYCYSITYRTEEAKDIDFKQITEWTKYVESLLD